MSDDIVYPIAAGAFSASVPCANSDMFKRIGYGLAVLLLVASGCKRQTQPPQIKTQFRDLDIAYCSNDVRAAERALIEHLEKLSKQESNGVKSIEYDMARAITHGRLFLIYRHTGETNKMRSAFDESMKYLQREGQEQGSLTETLSYEAFAAKIERIDGYLHPGWKTNGTASPKGVIKGS